jgi:hypothetical protein
VVGRDAVPVLDPQKHEREGRKVTRRKKPGELTEQYFYIALPGELSRAPQVNLGAYGKASFPFSLSGSLIIDALFFLCVTLRAFASIALMLF